MTPAEAGRRIGRTQLGGGERGFGFRGCGAVWLYGGWVGKGGTEWEEGHVHGAAGEAPAVGAELEVGGVRLGDVGVGARVAEPGGVRAKGALWCVVSGAVHGAFVGDGRVRA